MNTIKKIKVTNALKWAISMLLTSCFYSINIQAQEKFVKKPVVETQADLDWKELIDAVNYLGPDYQKAVDAGVLEMRRYEDEGMRLGSQLAKAFWKNHPLDRRRNEALYHFFGPYFEPHFISKEIPDSLAQLLSDKNRRSSKRYERLVPRDNVAQQQWRHVGDEMVASVLNSDASIALKEIAEFQLIVREFRQAMKLERPLDKEKSEAEFWHRFEIQYWQHIRLRLENHINKYAALEVVASRVQTILTTLKYFSVAASEAYWNYFFETYGSDNPLANQPGIKALHALTAENVAAIKTLKLVEYTKPLEMSFTTMDGSIVDLKKLRGKVVLIDFWATYCGPCIKEMPHVRALYDKYKAQGFEVIGIAADGDGEKARIEGILKKTGANWPQRLDKGAGALVSYHALYNIKVLPTVWLLNREGVLVDTNARGKRLEPLLRKYLGLEKQ